MSQNPMPIDGSKSDIPVSEVYWTLVAKADKKFSKVRDLPYYQRTRHDTYFYKVFEIYTKLWKFQQENRTKLVDAGLKRWEVGEIASRIGQLYFGQYMRTGEASYLSESYIFYEAILTREYFKDGLHQDMNLASKQLRFIARFLTVCLVLNRREMVYHLVNQLKLLLDECKRAFQENDFREWKVVVQEIVKFLKVDTAFMNLRPLRYSVVLDPQPDSLPNVLVAKRKLKLRDSLLCSYHPNEVKFSELTLDTFRMLQCLEWEPSGSFYQARTGLSIGIGSGSSQNGAPGTSRVNQEMTDPTLPPNPRKAILYRPSVTHFMAILGTACEELPPDGVLLIYLSTSGNRTHPTPSSHPSKPTGFTDNIASKFEFHSINSESISSKPTSTEYDSADCLHFGPRGNGGLNCIYPSDILSFTRRPLFLVIDSQSSKAFKSISGSERGEPVAMLLSPATSLPFPCGSLLTSFLAAPLQSLVLLLGFQGPDIEKDLYSKADKQLDSSLNEWGSLLASASNLDPIWAQILGDPFLRRLLVRFIFCRSVLSLYSSSSNNIEFLPECMPPLPETVSPMSSTCKTAVLQIAGIFGATNKFIIPEGTVLNQE